MANVASETLENEVKFLCVCMLSAVVAVVVVVLVGVVGAVGVVGVV